MAELALKCRCGTVTGYIHHAGERQGIHATCYCDDCQAFAKHLQREQDTLNINGGTEVYITAPAHIEFVQGKEQLTCLRLTRKGLYRWYTECCDTPVANVASSAMPFVSVIHTIMDETQKPLLGPLKGHVQVKYASGELTPELKKAGVPYRLLANSALKVLSWKLTGKGTPNPFFDAEGKATRKPTVLDA